MVPLLGTVPRPVQSSANFQCLSRVPVEQGELVPGVRRFVLDHAPGPSHPRQHRLRQLAPRQPSRHRADPACAGCHERLDPLGFALENYDTTGRWRDRYPNEREVDASGRLFREHDFSGAVEFKRALVEEERRFVTAFTAHLLRYAAARELGPADRVTVTELVDRTEQDGWTLRSLLRAVALERANTGP